MSRREELLAMAKAERDRRERIKQLREIVEAGAAVHGSGFYWDAIHELRKLANPR